MEFIQGTTLVHLKIKCWGGSKKASRDHDIKLGTNGSMPSEKLLELGRKKIFPPKAIDPMLRHRKTAERHLLVSGTRFIGGYAIPDSEVESLSKTLDGVKKKFYEDLAHFLDTFEENKQKWLSENSEFESILRDQTPDKDYVEKAFSFEYKLFKLDALPGSEPDSDDVANQVLHEIGQSCKRFSERLLTRNQGIGSANLKRQILPVIQKLDLLSFGNHRMNKVLSEFQALDRSIPDGHFKNDDPVLSRVIVFLSMCADPDRLERIIDGSLSVDSIIRKSSQATPSTTNDGPVSFDSGDSLSSTPFDIQSTDTSITDLSADSSIGFF